jgi:crossover junction endodeoxyribonuclease RuvC
MTILGIDPGLAATGWGLIRPALGGAWSPVNYGCIVTKPAQTLIVRLAQLAAALKTIIQESQPEACAIEEIFFAKDSRTAASVGHARGVILFVLHSLNIPIFEYNPRQIKMALTGFGAAEKPQMQKMVQRILNLRELPRPDDAADALAIALCHCQTQPLKLRMGKAVAS